MTGRPDNMVPDVPAYIEELYESLMGWAEKLGVESQYYDRHIEEGGSYEWAQSLRGQAYIEELATNDEAVTALNQRIAELDAVDDRLYALRHKAQLADSALTRRQREILAHLVS